MIQFPKLVQEAHGCEQPRAIRTYVNTDDDKTHALFRVYLPAFDVTLNVPMPVKVICYHLATMQTPGFAPDLPWEHVEHFISKYELRVVDAIAFSLAAYHAQPADVQTYLIKRFATQLEIARSLAEQWWTNIQNI